MEHMLGKIQNRKWIILQYSLFRKPFYWIICLLAFKEVAQIEKSRLQNYKGKEFGALPNDEKVIQRLSETCCKIGGNLPQECAILYIEQALYHISESTSTKDPEEAMSGKLGCKFPRTNYSFQIRNMPFGLDFWWSREICHRGAGVQLLCDGWMEPTFLFGTLKI